MSFAPLETVDCPVPEKVTPGELPRLDWIEIARLRIDESYQRPVMQRGRKNIASIVTDFRWNRFSPLVVTPIPDDLFAVIDGQHRAIGANRLGIKKVPCQIVTVAPKEAGRIFAIINGNVTPMSPQYLFKAELASGQKWAVSLHRICKAAGLEPLTYPVQISKQKPRQTMMIGTLRHRIDRYGGEIVGLALEGMMKSPQAERPGFARSLALDAAISAVHATPDALRNQEATIAALSRIDYASLSRATVVLPKEDGRGRPRYIQKPQLSTVPSLALIKNSDREDIIDLQKRRYPPSAIAAKLRLPYAEVQRVLDGARR